MVFDSFISASGFILSTLVLHARASQLAASRSGGSLVIDLSLTFSSRVEASLPLLADTNTMTAEDISPGDYKGGKDGHNVSLSDVGDVSQHTTVERRYMGSPADQKEMQQLGRV